MSIIEGKIITKRQSIDKKPVYYNKINRYTVYRIPIGNRVYYSLGYC